MHTPSSAKWEPPQGSSNSTSGRKCVNQSPRVASPRHQRRQPRCVLTPSSAITGPSSGRTTNTRAFESLASGSETSTGMTWPGRRPEMSTAVPEESLPRNASNVAAPTSARATTESAMSRHARTPQASHSRSPISSPARVPIARSGARRRARNGSSVLSGSSRQGSRSCCAVLQERMILMLSSVSWVMTANS
jgi:hypothetical protein